MKLFFYECKINLYMKIRFGTIVFIHMAFALFINHEVQSQNTDMAGFKYVSPVPGSKYIMPGNNIALRHGDLILLESLNGFSMEVTGTKSGRIKGDMVLSDDARTVIFKPNTPYEFGERIKVVVNGNLKTRTGLKLKGLEFNFTVTPVIPELPRDYFLQEEPGHSSNQPVHRPDRIKSINDNNLPEDFPELTVNISNNPVEGEYYFSTPFGYWGWFPDNIPYLVIFDNTCVPVYYKKLNFPAYDFRKLVDGTLSYYNNTWPTPTFEIMNSSFETIDNYTIQGGYRTDFHEFFKLGNGHVFITAYDPQIVGMDTVVAGGDPNAIVSGWIIQELDMNKNVVFQWRSWDHYQLTDADDHVDLTAAIIDVFHGNAIDVYSESALILSPRNNNEITKIDWNTGEIIWRLGGKNNMFQFVNDTLHFSRAHDCRMLPNGNLSLFDNGTYHPEPIFSSALEYELDEENLIASLVSRIRSNPDIEGVIMGNVQTKGNGNRITGWGSGVPAITEFDANGDVAMEIYFSGINYRAYRMPWQTDCFSVDKDTLGFGDVYYQSTATKNITVTNNAGYDIKITSVYSKNAAFSSTEEFPVLVPEGESKTLKIKFDPDTLGIYTDMITMNSDINEDTLVQRIAQQVFVTGVASQNQGIDEMADMNVKLFPQPVSNILTIHLKRDDSEMGLELFTISGKIVYSAIFRNTGSYQLDMGEFKTGLYFIQLKEKQSGETGYFKVVKK